MVDGTGEAQPQQSLLPSQSHGKKDIAVKKTLLTGSVQLRHNLLVPRGSGFGVPIRLASNGSQQWLPACLFFSQFFFS